MEVHWRMSRMMAEQAVSRQRTKDPNSVAAKAQFYGTLVLLTVGGPPRASCEARKELPGNSGHMGRRQA